jgi:hypothetical protein
VELERDEKYYHQSVAKTIWGLPAKLVLLIIPVSFFALPFVFYWEVVWSGDLLEICFLFFGALMATALGTYISFLIMGAISPKELGGPYMPPK